MRETIKIKKKNVEIKTEKKQRVFYDKRSIYIGNYFCNCLSEINCYPLCKISDNNADMYREDSSYQTLRSPCSQQDFPPSPRNEKEKF